LNKFKYIFFRIQANILCTIPTTNTLFSSVKKNDGEHLLDITHKKYHLIEYANRSFAKVSHFVSVAATPANWSP